MSGQRIERGDVVYLTMYGCGCSWAAREGKTPPDVCPTHSQDGYRGWCGRTRDHGERVIATDPVDGVRWGHNPGLRTKDPA